MTSEREWLEGNDPRSERERQDEQADAPEDWEAAFRRALKDREDIEAEMDGRVADLVRERDELREALTEMRPARDRTVGDLIDGLGVTPTRHETDLFTSAVVVLIAVEEDGSERLSVAWSDGLSWITRRGTALSNPTWGGDD